MKTIRIILLVLIIIGLGLIATEEIWVPKAVAVILGSVNSKPSATIDPKSTSIYSQTLMSTSTITGTATDTNAVTVNMYTAATPNNPGMDWFGDESIPVVNGKWSLPIPPDILMSLSNYYGITLQIGTVSASGTIDVLATSTVFVTNTDDSFNWRDQGSPLG